MNNHFAGVTLLVTHYNRSSSLKRLLETFRQLGCSFEDIVVSDDGSKPDHLTLVRQYAQTYPFRLITTPVNKGLGNNINKGQDAVQTPYTLYIQEDFVPKASFARHFADALAFMQQDPGLDLVRFYAYFRYPYLKPYGKGFSEMIFKPELWYSDHLKFYLYSDHPHLRRSHFPDKFGRYAEGIHSDKTEFLMCLSVIKKKARGLFLNQFSEMFDQLNPPEEPSTIGRSDWRQSRNPLFLLLRWGYLKIRLVKNSYELATLTE
ncbi:hypothetical protein GCM10023187_33310 [Nibrella viscosa]|uniref:Glycosyltransferase 2-like domain-containing protein n=1 Tax=Nibrella viscosa TaxID=1084524 RepID=A0ABP8KLP6_9BACT